MGSKIGKIRKLVSCLAMCGGLAATVAGCHPSPGLADDIHDTSQRVRMVTEDMRVCGVSHRGGESYQYVCPDTGEVEESYSEEANTVLVSDGEREHSVNVGYDVYSYCAGKVGEAVPCTKEIIEYPDGKIREDVVTIDIQDNTGDSK